MFNETTKSTAALHFVDTPLLPAPRYRAESNKKKKKNEEEGKVMNEHANLTVSKMLKSVL